MTTKPTFDALMARLDELQQLRYADPRQALALLAAEGPWTLPHKGELALLQARHAMFVASAHVVLGEHSQAASAFQRMAKHLDEPALQAAEEPLLSQVRNCAAAGANARAVLAQAVGDGAGALHHYLHALDLTRRLGNPRREAYVLANLGNTLQEAGLQAEALARLREAATLATAQDMAELLGDVHHNIGNALAASGEGDAALASNRRALQAYTDLKLPQKQRYAYVAVAERLLELGRVDEAAQALLDREQLPQDFDNRSYEAYARHLQGLIAAARQRPDEAQAHQQAAHAISLELSDAVGQARALLAQARLCQTQGRVDDASAKVDAALAALAGATASRLAVDAHELAWRLARARNDLPSALDHLERYHAAYAEIHNADATTRARHLAVLHEVDLARSEARQQRLESARLAEALAEISARLAGARDGNVSPQAPAEPADLQALGLTPREAEVLYWVALGKTNEDVATILNAGQSTVKKHLLRIFDKLGVENRTAAAHAARQLRR